MGALALPASPRAEVGEGDISIQFNRDIRPILSNTCFECHGPDENARQAGMRLDTYEGATGVNPSGKRAIVPGSPGESELVRRISSPDDSYRMPPRDSGKSLDPSEIDRLTRWVSEGGDYERHWSFVKPKRAPLPETQRKEWPLSPLDHFVLARLEREGLEPSPEAGRYTLVRRLYLDLIGLPPTPEEVEEFVEDTNPFAYERLVSRLLASPHFGEHWAQMWLDLARYADTKGYEADRDRSVWRYRDWVIDAFNDDMPFDRFTFEQLAGDLIESPTEDQLIATVFHRNTMTNDEGGSDNEEFRVAAVVDRVNTTMAVWMGMTVGCAQCHTHKFDPITQQEYYGLFAIFNQTEDGDFSPEEIPALSTPTAPQERSLEYTSGLVKEVERELEARFLEIAGRQGDWEAGVRAKDWTPPVIGPWHALGPFHETTFDGAFKTRFGPEDGVDLADTYGEGDLDWVERPEWTDGETHMLEGEYSATYLYRTVDCKSERDAVLRLGSDDGISVRLNGRLVHTLQVVRSVSPGTDEIPIRLKAGRNTILLKIINDTGACGFNFKLDLPTVPEDVLKIVRAAETMRSPEQARAVTAFYRGQAPQLDSLRLELASYGAQRMEAELGLEKTPIMRELDEAKRRETFLLRRGNYLDKLDPVTAGVPAVFHRMDEELPRNRAGLAKWLVDEENPLTARVLVNRYWERLFGRGLVVTSEDFGTRGEPPAQPELLDWLALDLVKKGWSTKRLLRTIVTSATYRQASAVSPELAIRDPYNELLARGPRRRLDAENLRDQALAASGLLSRKMHGPSVMPPQPENSYQNIGMNQWVTSEGEDRYRRGLYTFWRRTSPYPSMAIFDAPTREVCTIRRSRTNTPLQALVMMNDPVYVEAAQAMARRVIRYGGDSVESRAGYAFRLALVRPPTKAELKELTALYASEYGHYTADAESSAELSGPLPSSMSAPEVAAWTVVSNVVMNLDEFLTKR